MERGDMNKGFPKEPEEFEDNLILNSRVKINWKDAPAEYGIYQGYLGGNTRRCLVYVESDFLGLHKVFYIWIDRTIIEQA